MRGFIAMASLMAVPFLSAPTWAQANKVVDVKCVPAPGAQPRSRPSFVATIASNASEPGQFKIEQSDLTRPISVTADRIVDERKSQAPISLVVLVQGDEMWMGNKSHETNQADQMAGAFKALKGVLKTIVAGVPAGSKAALIVYGKLSGMVKYPMGPVDGLPTAIGAQKDYDGVQGVPLLPGLAAATRTLAATAGRRVLVVIGDGDSMTDEVSTQLLAAIDQLKKLHTETYAIHFMTHQDNAATRTDRLLSLASTVRNGFRAKTLADFDKPATTIQRRLSKRIHVHFSTTSFKLDGKPHTMRVSYKGDELTTKQVDFCKFDKQSALTPEHRPKKQLKPKGCGCESGQGQGGTLLAFLLCGILLCFGTRRSRC